MRSALACLATALAALGSTHCAPPRVEAKDALTLRVNLANEDFTLPNGLRVVLHPDKTATTAVVRVRYHVGSKDDPAGKSGLAHLFEHLMFLETPRTAPGDFMQRLEAAGGVETNASTTRDRTDYHEVVPPSQVGLALWLEAGRMAHPVEDIDPKAFTAERNVVQNEWREHYDDVAFGHVYGFALDAVYGRSHPYGRPTIGDPKEVASTSLDDVKAFAAKYYRPNNATLVVCGAFNPAVVKKAIDAHFGPIPGAPVPPRRQLAPVKLEESKRVEVVAKAEAPMIMMAWPAPPPGEPGYEELSLALEVLEGDLWHRLVTEKKSAESVDVGLDPGHLGSLASLEIKLKPGGSTSEALDVANEYLTRTAAIGRTMPWSSFGDFKSRQMVRKVATLEDPESRASRILYDLEFFGVADGMQEQLRRIQRVKSEELGSAAEHFLVDAKHATVVVSTDPNAPRSGRRR
jgi:zinc protease